MRNRSAPLQWRCCTTANITNIPLLFHLHRAPQARAMHIEATTDLVRTQVHLLRRGRLEGFLCTRLGRGAAATFRFRVLPISTDSSRFSLPTPALNLLAPLSVSTPGLSFPRQRILPDVLTANWTLMHSCSFPWFHTALVLADHTESTWCHQPTCIRARGFLGFAISGELFITPTTSPMDALHNVN